MKKAFTLIELIVYLLIFSILLLYYSYFLSFFNKIKDITFVDVINNELINTYSNTPEILYYNNGSETYGKVLSTNKLTIDTTEYSYNNNITIEELKKTDIIEEIPFTVDNFSVFLFNKDYIGQTNTDYIENYLISGKTNKKRKFLCNGIILRNKDNNVIDKKAKCYFNYNVMIKKLKDKVYVLKLYSEKEEIASYYLIFSKIDKTNYF